MPKAQRKPESAAPSPSVDPSQMAGILSDVLQRIQPLIVAAMEKSGKNMAGDPLDIRGAYVEFLKSLLSDPETLANLQLQYWQNWMAIWENVWKRYQGDDVRGLYQPETGDKRFKSEEWQNNLLFDFIKQSYLMTRQWIAQTVENTHGIDAATRERLAFSARQFADAISPTNFVLTNPDVLRETVRTGGENLVRGFENLIRDMERGSGDLKISTTDYTAFELGKNLAMTPGQVVYQNAFIQLIQYAPTTGTVFKRPLLVIPPWINKYYILDMRPENSYAKWLVDQGHTVFMISWINPDAQMGKMDFDDYMKHGILDALAHIEQATGERDANIIGYCIGGTLLSMTLSWMKAKGLSHKVASATFLTTLIDFENSGELKLFADDKAIAFIDSEMEKNGVLPGSYLQKTFSALRANDLIWSFVVNNYLMGKEPFPFDLLYWNDDSTNMPAALHGHYLRAMYRDNLLVTPGGLSVDGVPIDIRRIDTPSYFLSTRDDHIAPWKATYAGALLFSGDVVFTLAGSGHIAGVVNPPAGNKYAYWTSDKMPDRPDEWLAGAKETPGSWWTHWQGWIEPFTSGHVPARTPKNPIEPAPGQYVKKKISA